MVIKEMDISILGRWMFYSVLIGIVGGLGAIIFSYLLGNSTRFFSGYLAGYVPPAPAAPALILRKSTTKPLFFPNFSK